MFGQAFYVEATMNLRLLAVPLHMVLLIPATESKAQPPGAPIRLTYSPTIGSTAHDCIDGQGLKWTLSLSPDVDIKHRPLTLELQLSKYGDDTNALYNSLNLHGTQPFIFAARDFVDGPSKSTYGTSRQLYIREPAVSLEVAIVGARVYTDQNVPYFRTMTLRVNVRPHGGHAFKCNE